MTIFAILRGTPLWVWALFTYLIIIGVMATKERVVSLFRLGIMPLIFIVLSIFSIQRKFGLYVLPFSIWLLFLGIGIVVGYRTVKRHTIRFDQHKKLIYLPGSFIPLVLSLLFFSIKYCIGASCALHLITRDQLWVMLLDLGLSGIITGLSSGRFLHIRTLYKKVMAD